MDKKNLHLRPHGAGWTYCHEDGEPMGEYVDRDTALRAAEDHLITWDDGALVIHDERDQVVETLDRARVHADRFGE